MTLPYKLLLKRENQNTMLRKTREHQMLPFSIRADSVDGNICWFTIIQLEITFRWILDGFFWARISPEDEGHRFATQ